MPITGNTRVATPESSTLHACIDLLTAERIWFRRMNTGAIKLGDRFVRFGQKGDADILASVRLLDSGGNYIAYPLWIETKSSSGKQSEAQKLFQREVEAQQHGYLLVKDVDVLRNWLRAKGVMR